MQPTDRQHEKGMDNVQIKLFVVTCSKDIIDEIAKSDAFLYIEVPLSLSLSLPPPLSIYFHHHPSICPSTHVLIYPPNHLSVYPPIRQCLCLFVFCLAGCLSAYLSIYLIGLATYLLSTHLHICVNLTIYLSI